MPVLVVKKTRQRDGCWSQVRAHGNIIVFWISPQKIARSLSHMPRVFSFAAGGSGLVGRAIQTVIETEKSAGGQASSEAWIFASRYACTALSHLGQSVYVRILIRSTAFDRWHPCICWQSRL